MIQKILIKNYNNHYLLVGISEQLLLRLKYSGGKERGEHEKSCGGVVDQLEKLPDE